jgi:hypothetical protein
MSNKPVREWYFYIDDMIRLRSPVHDGSDQGK